MAEYSAHQATQESLDDQGQRPEALAVPWEWSGFRDKRLGRLVASFRYDFHKAAAALGDEFGCKVDADECRKRYKELTRPSAASSQRAGVVAANEEVAGSTASSSLLPGDSGRAKDAPEPDAAVINEV